MLPRNTPLLLFNLQDRRLLPSGASQSDLLEDQGSEMVFLGSICTPELGAHCYESTVESDVGKSNSTPAQNTVWTVFFGWCPSNKFLVHNPNCGMALSEET